MSEPKIVGFLCNWCSYAAADQAGTARHAYPENIRIIRIPCSGRMDPKLIFKAFQEGADGVMVAGCHPGDCHYTNGNYYARRKLALTRQLLEFMGVEPERMRFEWISAAEGNRFADVVAEFTREIKELNAETPLKREAVTR